MSFRSDRHLMTISFAVMQKSANSSQKMMDFDEILKERIPSNFNGLFFLFLPSKYWENSPQQFLEFEKCFGSISRQPFTK